MIRLWTAASLGIWGLVLAEFGASRILSDVFFVAGLLLLALWTPGAVPTDMPTE